MEPVSAAANPISNFSLDPNLSLEPLLTHDSTEQSYPVLPFGLRVGVEFHIYESKNKVINSIYLKPALTLKTNPSWGFHVGGEAFHDGAKGLGLGLYGEREFGHNVDHLGIEGNVLGVDIGGGIVTAPSQQVIGGEVFVGIDILNFGRIIKMIAKSGG